MLCFPGAFLLVGFFSGGSFPGGGGAFCWFFSTRGMLNMPKPMTVKNFNNFSNVFCDAAKVVAEKSTNAAANVLKNSNDGDILDIGVSVDGSWQRRGYSSMNGVVAVLSIDDGMCVHLSVWTAGGLWISFCSRTILWLILCLIA